MTWLEQTVNLSAFVGSTVRIRFRLSSDGSDQRDGWYLDDIRLLGYHESVLSVSSTDPKLPSEDKLHKNYPNPFNPSTTIRFELAKSGTVRIAVYDILGKEIATVVDGELAAGSYTKGFDAGSAAGGLASGMYFLRFTVSHSDGSIYAQTEKLSWPVNFHGIRILHADCRQELYRSG